MKHQYQTSDEEILQTILESPYLQYFIGLPRFATNMPFEASSLSRVRERLGEKTFAAFEQTLIATLVAKKLIRANGLQTDATVYESEITYPTDCGLLEKARLFCVKQIEHLREVVPQKVRTYCRVVRKAYLNFTKKKRKTQKEIRRMQKASLQYLRRNMEQVTNLITKAKDLGHTMAQEVTTTFATVKKIYEHQKEMYDNKKKRVEARIVSLCKPYVRPIVRGKSGKDVEFGAKVQLSCVDGYLFPDHISFDNFNEGAKLQDSITAFEKRFARAPEYVAMDQIYGTRENREYLKEKEIRASVKPLGRPKQDNTSSAEERWRKRKQRNAIGSKAQLATAKTITTWDWCAPRLRKPRSRGFKWRF